MSERLRKLLGEDEGSMGGTGTDPDLALGLEDDAEGDFPSKEDDLADAVMDALDDLEAVAKQLQDAADGGEDDYDPEKIDALLNDDDAPEDEDAEDAFSKDDQEEYPAEKEPDVAATGGEDELPPEDKEDEFPGEDEVDPDNSMPDAEYPAEKEPEDDGDRMHPDGDDDEKADFEDDEEPAMSDPDKDHPDELKDLEMEIQMKKKELADLESKKSEIEGRKEPEEESFSDGDSF